MSASSSVSASSTTNTQQQQQPFDWSTVITDEQEIDAIRALRLKLASIENESERTAAEQLHDGDLMRFVRARELNVEKSMHLLLDAVKWRLAVRPDALSTANDAELAGCEKLQTLWLSEQLDALNRPVLYMKPGGANPHSVEKRVLFLVLQLERAVARMAPPVTQFTWICDFSGYGQRARSPGGMQVARESLHVLQTAYCERLGAMFIVNSPFFFSMLYSCMSPFMSARTKAKIRWISGDEAALRAQLAEVFLNIFLFSVLATILACVALVQIAFAADLQLGYPTKIHVPGGTGKGQTCVLWVDVPLGTTTLRIYVDKGWDVLNWTGGKSTKVYAGWSLKSSPGAVASGSVTGAKDNGDVMLTIDVTGSIGKYWILVESENEADVFVSAVAYDIAQRPRVSVELGKRTGVVAVEAGASQIYRMQLPANKATTVNINIDAGWFGTIGEAYDIYVNILDDKKIEMITDNLSLTSILDFLNKLSNAFKTGKVDALFPKFLTPDADTNDLTRTGHVANFGKASFPVDSSKQPPIVYVAIKPRSSLPWSGQLSSFTVAFSTTETPANSLFATASCENPKRRRSVDDVEQAAADPCASKTCDACVDDTACQFCYGKSVTSNACRSKSAGACPADSAAATKAQCTECVKLEQGTCSGNANCKFCSQLSAGDVVEHCVNAWLCPADTTAGATTTSTAAGGSTAGGATTAAASGDVSKDAAGAASIATLSVAVASSVAALLLSL